MNAKTTAIALISFAIGILLMRLLDELQPEIKRDDSVYKKAIEQRDDQIKRLNEKIDSRSKRDSMRHDTIFVERIKYKTIYEKIPYSNDAERDAAFDSLLSK